MRVAAVVLLAAALGGCGFSPAKLFLSRADIEVREVGRSLYCNTPGDAARAVLLEGPQAVREWQAARGVTLGGAPLAQAPYAIVEMGTRPTGGYGLAVSRAAELRGDLLVLQATFVSPAPGAIRTQAVSSPCALVQLPPGRYGAIEVYDQTGEVRATDAPLPPPVEESPAEAEPPTDESPPPEAVPEAPADEAPAAESGTPAA